VTCASTAEFVENDNRGLILAQLVQPEDVDEENFDGTYVDFPESLTGGSWPERTPISDEELNQFLVSVSAPE
jgi:hypothetical protein